MPVRCVALIAAPEARITTIVGGRLCERKCAQPHYRPADTLGLALTVFMKLRQTGEQVDVPLSLLYLGKDVNEEMCDDEWTPRDNLGRSVADGAPNRPIKPDCPQSECSHHVTI